MPTLPSSLPWSFSDYTPPDALRALDGTPLAWIEDHGDLGVDLLLSQFKGKPLLEAVLRAFLRGVTDLDDAAWQVLTERALDTAVGAQLDTIGKLVDLPRTGWADESYRRLLAAQILTLRSEGTWPNLAAILVAMGFDVSLMTFSEYYPAALVLTLGEPVPAPLGADDVFGFLERARAAGVRLTLEYPVDDVDETFTLALTGSAEADTARGLGDTVAGLVGGTLSGLLASSEGA